MRSADYLTRHPVGEVSPTSTICKFPIASIIIKNSTNYYYKHLEITSESKSEIEFVDARWETVTTGSRNLKCNTVISFP